MESTEDLQERENDIPTRFFFQGNGGYGVFRFTFQINCLKCLLVRTLDV